MKSETLRVPLKKTRPIVQTYGQLILVDHVNVFHARETGISFPKEDSTK